MTRLSPAVAVLPAHRALAGVLNALGCLVSGDCFNLLQAAPARSEALEVLAHRILGSALILLALVVLQGRGQALLADFRNWRRLGFYAITNLLISGNWLLYIWAVQQGRSSGKPASATTSTPWSTWCWACCFCMNGSTCASGWRSG